MTSYAQDSRFPGHDPYAPLKDLPSFELASADIVEGEEIAERFRAPSDLSLIHI